MNRPVRFALIAAAWFVMVMLFAVLQLGVSSRAAITSSPETSAMCTTDTDCVERFGGDGGPGR